MKASGSQIKRPSLSCVKFCEGSGCAKATGEGKLSPLKKAVKLGGKFQPLLHTHNQNVILGRFYILMHLVTRNTTKPPAIFA